MQTLQEMTGSECREAFKQMLHDKKRQRAEAPTEPIDSALPSDPARTEPPVTLTSPVDGSPQSALGTPLAQSAKSSKAKAVPPRESAEEQV